jgi:hypothetical protein
LTRRQSRARYNRGTFNPLSRNPSKAIPQRAPYYPVATGDTLKERAYKNMRAMLGDRLRYNDKAVRKTVYNHASDEALRRMAGASADELETWAEAQRRYSYTTKSNRKIVTPEWIRSLGWSDNGRWRNVFWYH